jgi:predicted nucleotidyltransferase
MLKRQYLEQIRSFAVERQDVVALYLFGSEATGRDRKGSDVDLAIMVSGRLGGFERVEVETELSNLLGRDVELVVFNDAAPLLQHQILKYGILIYESNARERVRREVTSRCDYFDSQSMYKEVRSLHRD